MKRARNPNSPTTHHKSRKLKPIEDDVIFNLPDEIVTEILLRLPVKSIVKFRCVSKPWLSLISSKQFIKNQLKISTEDPEANGYEAIIASYSPLFVLKQCSLRSLLYEQSPINSIAIEIDYPTKHPHNYVRVLDCCKGLICINDRDQNLFLWNPSIKESIKLPSLNMTLNEHSHSVFGFGFDESNDDYKVVQILCLKESPDMPYRSMKSIVNIYSLKTDSWKRVDDFKGAFEKGHSGKFANGKLHWSATSGVGSTLKWDIISLDLESELFGTVDEPDYSKGVYLSRLGVLGGCICVLCHNAITRVELWILKEYGVKGSWSKIFSFTHDWDGMDLLSANPVCMLPDGEILLEFRKCFVVCNPRYNSFRLIEINDLDRIIRSNVYVESLVSPVTNGRFVRGDISDESTS